MPRLRISCRFPVHYGVIGRGGDSGSTLIKKAARGEEYLRNVRVLRQDPDICAGLPAGGEVSRAAGSLGSDLFVLRSGPAHEGNLGISVAP
jgi:hypothetical protein